MPRRPRLFVEGLACHVDTRDGRGEAPFASGDEADRLASLTRDVTRRDGLTVFARRLVPDLDHASP